MSTEATPKIEEGGECPEAGCTGTLFFPPPENCSCHISPPCHSCTSVQLTCDECGWVCPPPVREETWRHIGGGIAERVVTRPSHEFGDGKRIYDWDYDSSSGSTMVYKGKYKGDVTAEDILKFFGDGTFGHRGPSLHNGIFTYTKITD